MDQTHLIGRKKEKQYLKDCLASTEAEFIAVVGRRRVGKTFLIRQAYQNQIDFELVGIHNGNKSEQLANFHYQLTRTFDTIPLEPPTSWIDAFQRLIDVLSRLDKERIIIFLDELPWLASAKSGFMKGLEFFWNSWASRQKVILVVSGSAASWMHRHIVTNTGGMHNRMTRYIHLQPFTLAEVKEYLTAKRISLNNYQICLLYMALGGIPYYLKLVAPGQSAVQNIQRLLFSSQGPLRYEFEQLYAALFDSEERHIEIIKCLATNNKGFTSSEIAAKTSVRSGGTLTKTLKELERSGFISSYTPFYNKKRGTRYRLTDEYSLFYLKCVANADQSKHFDFKTFSQTSRWKSWTGYAFENLIWKHVPQIADALGIQGIHYETSSIVAENDHQEKFQIDLLIDRADQTVNLCEIKFYDHEFHLTSDEAKKIRSRIEGLKSYLNKPKHIFVTIISPYGMKSAKNSLGLIDQQFNVDILFH